MLSPSLGSFPRFPIKPKPSCIQTQPEFWVTTKPHTRQKENSITRLRVGGQERVLQETKRKTGTSCPAMPTDPFLKVQTLWELKRDHQPKAHINSHPSIQVQPL